MSGAMVRATLRDVYPKTQTRRLVKLPHNNPLGQWEPMTFGGPNGGRTSAGAAVPLQGGVWHTRTGECLASPHGQPGDRLWVREAWRYDGWCPSQYRNMAQGAMAVGIRYAADDAMIDHRVEDFSCDKHMSLRPSIHMPRWASRLTLEITDVRAERLQDISEQDAASEGVESLRNEGELWKDYLRSTAHCDELLCLSARESFRTLWDKLAAPDADWQTNPWVWVIEFKRVMP
nr:hypothetical protein [Paraburkholderia phenoliruptrix]